MNMHRQSACIIERILDIAEEMGTLERIPLKCDEKVLNVIHEPKQNFNRFLICLYYLRESGHISFPQDIVSQGDTVPVTLHASGIDFLEVNGIKMP